MTKNLDKVLDGKLVAAEIIGNLKTTVELNIKNIGQKPSVAFIRVGNDGASVSYVAQKERTAANIGIDSTVYVLNDETTTEAEVIALINKLNNDNAVHGILVQAPLPAHMDFVKVCNSINPQKDVDGFTATNFGLLCQETIGFVPCTPAGIIELLKYYNVKTAGKHAVIVNRSMIVGKPLAMLLASKHDFGNATVTICNSRTNDLSKITSSADILILACGKPLHFTKEFVKENATIIDVGITRVPAQTPKGYVLNGDADFENIYDKVSKITPVPGGVGPLTVAMLMHNTIKAWLNQEHTTKK